MIRAALVDYLKSSPGVRSFIEYTEAGRKRYGIYPFQAAQGKPYPRITYHKVGKTQTKYLSQTTNLAQVQIQLDVWSQRQETTAAINEALWNALANFRNRSMGSVYVRSIEFEDIGDTLAAPMDSSEAGIYRESSQLTIWYVREVLSPAGG